MCDTRHAFEPSEIPSFCTRDSSIVRGNLCTELGSLIRLLDPGRTPSSLTGCRPKALFRFTTTMPRRRGLPSRKRSLMGVSCKHSHGGWSVCSVSDLGSCLRLEARPELEADRCQAFQAAGAALLRGDPRETRGHSVQDRADHE